MITFIFFTSLSLFASSPSSGSGPVELLGSKSAGVKSFFAEVKETGVFPKPIFSSIWYQGENRITVLWTDPAELYGAISTLDSKAWRMTFPRSRQALIFRNLPSHKVPVNSQFMFDPEKVILEAGEKTTFLKMPVQKVTFRTVGEAVYISGGSWTISEAYTVPLNAQWAEPAYTREFVTMEINPREFPQKPVQLMPSYLETFEWDLLDRAITTQEFDAEVKNKYQMPNRLADFSRKRIVRQKGASPSIAGLYSLGERFVVLALHFKPSTPNLPANWGISLKTDRHQIGLIPGFVFPLVTLEINKIRYYLTGNIPVNQLVHLANQLDVGETPAKPNDPKKSETPLKGTLQK